MLRRFCFFLIRILARTKQSKDSLNYHLMDEKDKPKRPFRPGGFLDETKIVIDYLPDGAMTVYDVDCSGEMFNFELGHWDHVTVRDEPVRTYPNMIPLTQIDIGDYREWPEEKLNETLKEYARSNFHLGAGLIIFRKSDSAFGVYRTAIDPFILEEQRITNKEC